MSPDDLLAPAQQTDALQQEIDVPAAPTAWFLLPGVLLPSVTVAIEAATHMCAEALFDPIPTSAHLVLASAVPLVNLFVWWRLRTSIPEPRSLAWLLGAAAGVSAL